jgi:hypothetical protein
MAASITAFAQSQMPATSTTATMKKPPVEKPRVVEKVKVSTPLLTNPLKAPPPKVSDKIVRIDGESNQPWYRMAGPRPGYSIFPQPGQNDLGYNVFWIGAAPLR